VAGARMRRFFLSLSLSFALLASPLLPLAPSGRATFLQQLSLSDGHRDGKRERRREKGQRDGLIAEKITISLRLSHVKASWENGISVVDEAYIFLFTLRVFPDALDFAPAEQIRARRVSGEGGGERGALSKRPILAPIHGPRDLYKERISEDDSLFFLLSSFQSGGFIPRVDFRGRLSDCGRTVSWLARDFIPNSRRRHVSD